MKDYRVEHFGAGHQYESARSRLEKWLAAMKKHATFEVMTVSMEQVRESWQEITVFYSIDSMEEELFETRENLRQANEHVEYLLENEEYYKQRREHYLNKKAGKTMDVFGNVIVGGNEEDK